MTRMENICKNLHKVIDDNKTLYFSYETCIAFKINGKLTVCENIWSRTTGNHLNLIDNGDKKSRISYKDFINKLDNLQ